MAAVESIDASQEGNGPTGAGGDGIAGLWGDEKKREEKKTKMHGA